MLKKAAQNIGKSSRRLVNSIPGTFLTPTDSSGRVINRQGMYEYLVQNDLLRRDEAREIESTLTKVADRDRVAVQDLIDAGLTRPLRNIGVTLYQADRHSAVGDGHQSMSILDFGDRDQVEFTPTVFPVPVTSSQFQLDRRYVEAGRSQSPGVDTTNVEEHTRAVLRRLENTLVNGNSAIVVDSNALQGYTNLTARQTVGLNDVGWDATSDLKNAVQDVIDARAALSDDGYTGPYILYVPSDWEAVLDDDYKAESDATLKERILRITGIEDVKVLADLTADNAVLVQMTQSVVQYPIGQEITTVTWDLMGGLAQNWAIMEVSTFALKTAEDEDGNTTSGIAHIS